MDIFVIVSILLFGFILRLPFSILTPITSTNDGQGTFSKLDSLSKHLFPTFRIHDAANHLGKFPRPNLFHWFVSRFPKKLWRLLIVSGNVLPDLILAFLFYLLLPYVFPEMRANSRFLLVLLFVSTPIFFPYTARLKATNGRTVGFMFASAYLLLLPILNSGFFGVDPMIIYGLLGIIAFFTFWTSIFASQALVFVSIVYSLMNLNPMFVLPIFVVVGLAFLIPRLGVWDILSFKVQHTKFYIKILTTSFSTRERSLLNFLKLFDPRSTRSNRFELFLKHSPVLIALYSIPILFPIAYLLFSGPSNVDLGPSLQGSMNLLTLSIFIVFILTSISYGRLFGESERYLEYTVFPLLLLFGSLMYSVNSDSLVLALALFQLVILILVTILNWNGALEKLLSFQKSIPEEVGEVLAEIERQDPFAKILCVPFTGSRLFSSAGNLKNLTKFRYYYQLIASENNDFNFLKVSIDEMLGQHCPAKSTQYFLDKYGISFFIVENRYLLDGEFKTSLSEQCTKIVHIGPYELYKIA